MQVIACCTIVDELVSLDGKHFVNCTLRGCTLSYDGGVVILEQTMLSGCDYLFGGAARRTTDLLRAVGLLPAPFCTETQTEELVH